MYSSSHDAIWNTLASRVCHNCTNHLVSMSVDSHVFYPVREVHNYINSAINIKLKEYNFSCQKQHS